MTAKVLAKDVVDKWVKEVMTHSYDITIHAKDEPFREKFLRQIHDGKWDYKIISESKMVVSSNDPIALASLSLKLKKRGYLIED
jgi:hypothetical protein